MERVWGLTEGTRDEKIQCLSEEERCFISDDETGD